MKQPVNPIEKKRVEQNCHRNHQDSGKDISSSIQLRKSDFGVSLNLLPCLHIPDSTEPEYQKEPLTRRNLPQFPLQPGKGYTLLDNPWHAIFLIRSFYASIPPSGGGDERIARPMAWGSALISRCAISFPATGGRRRRKPPPEGGMEAWCLGILICYLGKPRDFSFFLTRYHR
jgi:hypothetical protein